MSVGNRIKALRKKHGLTQTELAKITNITYSVIASIESGRSEATTKTIINLSEIFKVSADYLLTGKENTAEISDEEKEVLNAMREDSAFKQVAIEAAKLKKKVINCFKIYAEQNNNAALNFALKTTIFFVNQ